LVFLVAFSLPVLFDLYNKTPTNDEEMATTGDKSAALSLLRFFLLIGFINLAPAIFCYLTFNNISFMKRHFRIGIKRKNGQDLFGEN